MVNFGALLWKVVYLHFMEVSSLWTSVHLIATHLNDICYHLSGPIEEAWSPRLIRLISGCFLLVVKNIKLNHYLYDNF